MAMGTAEIVVFVILGLYSIVGVAVIIEKYRYLGQASADLRGRIGSGTPAAPKTPALQKAFEEAHNGGGVASIDREIALVQDRFTAGMVYLATIGNTAPFVGLLGTVLGIMAAFANISKTGEAGFQAVSGPLSAALVATAAGLGVAIPAVIFYNYFGRRIQSLLTEVRYLIERELAQKAG